MKIQVRVCWFVAVLTLVTSVTPVQQLVAADPIANSEQVGRSFIPAAAHDVELMPGGILFGQVIDSAGRPLVGQAIIAQQSDREPITTRSDHEGRFRLSGLNAGLSHIAFGDDAAAYRCWSPNTAPPVAAKEILLTAGESVERGQRPIADFLTGPVLIGLIIAAAVAIPIAIHNSQKDAS